VTEAGANGKRAIPSQKKLWSAAWIIAEQYGAEGVGFADEMARSFEIGGKDLEPKIWRSIKDRVEALTAVQESGGALAQ